MNGNSAENISISNRIGVGIPLRNVYGGIFLVSTAVLLMEISLTRIFSYTIWYHFTYVTISLAMLGFGASGAILASSEKLARSELSLAHYASLIAAVSVPLMLVVISTVPFYPFQLFREPVQIVYMILYYVVVTLPFFCAGLTISCVFRSLPDKASTIYFWDLLGAGTGCFVVVTAIRMVEVPGVVALCGSLFLLAAAIFSESGSRLRRLLIIVAALVWIPMGMNVEKVLEFKASKEKWISQMHDKTITFSKWSPIFRVDAYELPNDKGIMQLAESVFGIRSKYLPPDMGYAHISHDGDANAMMIKTDDNLSRFAVFEKSILKAPYLLMDSPKVLIIGPGGGVDVGMALQSSARSVVAVELDPITVDLVRHKYGDFAGHIYDQPGTEVVVDEGRSFLMRTDETYDLIQMTTVDTLAALTSGAYVLAENYLYTVEAYESFLEHLTDDGILSVVVQDLHYKNGFPRHAARQTSLSVTALKNRGIENPERHIGVIASSRGDLAYPYVIILTKASPFTYAELRKLNEFANELSFDIWYLPDRLRTNPCARIASSGDAERSEYYANHPYYLQAPSDDSPFFFHYYKWKTLLKTRDIDTGHTGATGQLILLLILAFSIVFSAFLIIFPLLKFQKAGLQTPHKLSYVLYFAALGLGFIFIEISYIQRFILFLGYPTYSLTVILFSLLTFSGIGSYVSGKVAVSPKGLITIAVILLTAVALGYIVLLPPIFNHFLSAPKQIRILISLILLLPLGLLLGVFFPTGIKIISAESRSFVPWAWGINGCASVIGTVLSIIIAMTYGFDAVTVLAVIIYLLGTGMMVRIREEAPLNARKSQS